MSPFSSFIFFFTIKTNRFARCFARAFPERLFRRRRPLPITKRRIHKMSFFGIGQSKLLSVDVAFATPTRTCVVKSSYADAMHHVARETLPLITSGTRRARKQNAFSIGLLGGLFDFHRCCFDFDDDPLLAFSSDPLVFSSSQCAQKAIRSKAFCTSLQVSVVAFLCWSLCNNTMLKREKTIVVVRKVFCCTRTPTRPTMMAHFVELPFADLCARVLSRLLLLLLLLCIMTCYARSLLISARQTRGTSRRED